MPEAADDEGDVVRRAGGRPEALHMRACVCVRARACVRACVRA